MFRTLRTTCPCCQRVLYTPSWLRMHVWDCCSMFLEKYFDAGPFNFMEMQSMRTKIGSVVILLSIIGVIYYEATTADKNNTSLPIKSSPSPVVSPSPAMEIKGEKVKIEDAINFLKSYPVNKIESGMVDSTRFIYSQLPPIPLEKWIGSIMGDTSLEWEMDDCAEYDSNVDDNDKHCASFSVSVRTTKWRCPEINLNFDVGTNGTVYFLNDNSIVNDFGAKEGMQQIAELKEALDKVKAKTMPNRPTSLPAPSLKAMSDNDMIKHVKALDVHSLDPTLPSERFDKWLERAAHWPLQWWQASALKDYDARCEPKRLVIRVYPAYVHDPKNWRPPADIYLDIGSWEQGINGEPMLRIYFAGPSDGGTSSTTVNNLSALQKKFDEWYAALLMRKPTAPIPAKAPVVQNMTKLGSYSRIRSTPGWHCYGHELRLWKYGERVFGTLYDLDGQCADSRAPTYTIREVKYESTTGRLEFWSYGTPGYKFVGKMDQNIVTGKFLGMFDQEEVKLKSSKERIEPIPDSDKNVEAWCKDYAPTIRYGVEEEFKELCKSMGVD